MGNSNKRNFGKAAGFILAGLLAMLLPVSAQADDGFAALAAGGGVLAKTDAIENLNRTEALDFMIDSLKEIALTTGVQKP